MTYLPFSFHLLLLRSTLSLKLRGAHPLPGRDSYHSTNSNKTKSKSRLLQSSGPDARNKSCIRTSHHREAVKSTRIRIIRLVNIIFEKPTQRSACMGRRICRRTHFLRRRRARASVTHAQRNHRKRRRRS